MSCLDDIFKQKPAGEAKCPDHGKVLKREEVFRDKCAQKEILALECYCPYKSLGCLWTGLLAYLPDHDAECPYTKVKCPYSNLGCTVVVLRHLLAKHIENDCVYKVTECPYCHVGYPGVKMREHLEECRKFPVKCPHGCGESEILRENILEHSISCPRAPTQCRFKSMGCDFEGPRDSLDEHLSSSTTEHLILSTKSVERLTDELRNLKAQLGASQAMNQTYEERLALQNEALALNRQTLSTHQMKLTKVEENLSAQRTSIDEIRQKLTTELNSRENTTAGLNMVDIIRRLDFQDERLAVLGEDVRRLNQAPARPRYAASASAGGSDHRFDRVEHSLALHEIQLADQDLKLQIMETTSYDGIFLWKIDEFQRRFREAVDGKTISIYSPPFYTARYGYKLCVRAYLNGDGPMGKGKYLSLFIVVMRGEYDGLLSWPFRQKITMKLLDQDRVSDVTESFRPDPNSSSFQKPRSDMNIASGCPTFCTHNLLRSRGYIRDDSIFIKMVVDPTGMPVI